jgi:predicted kinase
MAKLIITRGLPGSGKSTWARARQARDPNLARVNRDDLRRMLFPDWPHGDPEAEEILTLVQEAAIEVLLEHTSLHVVADDTNLDPQHVQALDLLAHAMDAEFHVQDFTHVPLDVCIARDAARPNPVGEQVIRAMHEKHLAGGQS